MLCGVGVSAVVCRSLRPLRLGEKYIPREKGLSQRRGERKGMHDRCMDMYVIIKDIKGGTWQADLSQMGQSAESK